MNVIFYPSEWSIPTFTSAGSDVKDPPFLGVSTPEKQAKLFLVWDEITYLET